MVDEITIEGTSLKRNMHSKALLETDRTKAQSYLERRSRMKEMMTAKDNEISELKSQIAKLWEAINNLKTSG